MKATPLLGLGPVTLKLKSVAFLVPPLSLTTTFLTMRVPAMSLLVMVQVFVSSLPMATLLQFS